MKICGIYTITHIESGKVYVGLSVDIKSRWKQHRSFVKTNRRSAIYSAIRKYGLHAFRFEVVEECSQDVLEQREQYWIAKLDSYNNGYNLTAGGESNKVVSEATRKKISMALTGKIQSKELVEKRASKLRGMKRTPEQNKAKSELMKGVGKGRKLPEWVKEKIGKPFLGKKHSAKSIQKMSDAKKGTVFSEEHKRNLSESHKGYKFSEERKIKHSMALKAYWAKRKAKKEQNGRIET